MALSVVVMVVMVASVLATARQWLVLEGSSSSDQSLRVQRLLEGSPDVASVSGGGVAQWRGQHFYPSFALTLCQVITIVKMDCHWH